MNLKFNDDVFKKFPVLETDRLVLREITRKDVNEIYEVRSSKEAMKYFGKEPIKNLCEAEEMIKELDSSFLKKEGIRWGIVIKISNRLIGSGGIWRIMKDHLRGEIGYELSPDYWRQGIMFEALTAVLKFGFEKMNLHTIEANIDPENTASEKLLEKLGFKKEGHTTESYYFNGIFTDTAIYSLVRTSDGK
jgi:ribosomal-protein-alanine N-acetyltransferase